MLPLFLTFKRSLFINYYKPEIAACSQNVSVNLKYNLRGIVCDNQLFLVPGDARAITFTYWFSAI